MGVGYACMGYLYEYRIDLEIYVIRKVADSKENSWVSIGYDYSRLATVIRNATGNERKTDHYT